MMVNIFTRIGEWSYLLATLMFVNMYWHLFQWCYLGKLCDMWFLVICSILILINIYIGQYFTRMVSGAIFGRCWLGEGVILMLVNIYSRQLAVLSLVDCEGFRHVGWWCFLLVDLLGLVSVWCDYGEILILVNIDSCWLAVLSLEVCRV